MPGTTEREQAIGLLSAGRQESARTVVLETAANHQFTSRKQG
jgi:hypothetical protein